MYEAIEQPVPFDYELVDQETRHILKGLSNQLDGIYQNYSIEVGAVLYKAQQELADYDGGVFIKWIESKNFSKSNVYNYINAYKLFQNLENPLERDVFLDAPKSVQNEMAKPSAIGDVNQAVFDGDITTHKEYKALEKRYKEEIAEKDKQIDGLNQTIDEMNEQEPEVITKEVVPPNYDQMEQENKRLNAQVYRLNQQIEKANAELQKYEEDSATAEALRKDIDTLRKDKAKAKKFIDSAEELFEMEERFHEFFDKEMAPRRYKPIINNLGNSSAPDRIRDLVSLAMAWADDMNKMLPQADRKIIDGEIIND
ncbi:hypothetical protein [Aerococcus sp. UMB7834]|uniref:hypothetical protein n=1 Tax=Aerococcus sp. UMB7834 TaxID=3046342 RepID=UPI00254C55CE|nr:hypothetical protein [Aerococcus sp. UMB7834]MDK6804248.1 hypothetical protein [Aerococcus sp. UMB7834]